MTVTMSMSFPKTFTQQFHRPNCNHTVFWELGGSCYSIPFFHVFALFVWTEDWSWFESTSGHFLKLMLLLTKEKKIATTWGSGESQTSNTHNHSPCHILMHSFMVILDWKTLMYLLGSGQLSCVTVSLRDGQQLRIWETSFLMTSSLDWIVKRQRRACTDG